MKEEILAKVKQEMLIIIEKTTLHNIKSHRSMLIDYFDFLETLYRLPTFHTTQLDGSAEMDLKEIQQKQDQIIENQLDSPVYTFERKLRGGLFPALNYPIPEKMVRELGLEHNDIVKIIKSEVIKGAGIRYWFELVEKGNKGNDNQRVQFNYCIVERDPQLGSFMVRKTATDDIKVNGIPFTFLLSQKDATDFNIEVGDIVDIAYYENNIESQKVIWKHNTHLLSPKISATIEEKKLNRKSSSDHEENKEISYPIDITLFQNKTVAIVGSEYNMKLRYQQVFEQINCNLIHASGDEPSIRMESMLRKADIVVITIDGTGHHGAKTATEICKEHGIPFVCVDRNGPQYILLEIEKVLKRQSMIV